MVDKTEISNAIEIKDTSIERVAFDLMEKIASSECYGEETGYRKPNSREYFLKLYNQCHQVVDNRYINVSDLLKD